MIFPTLLIENKNYLQRLFHIVSVPYFQYKEFKFVDKTNFVTTFKEQLQCKYTVDEMNRIDNDSVTDKHRNVKPWKLWQCN